MTITRTRIAQRANIEVPFFKPAPDVLAYIKATYIDTGKFSSSNAFSEDQLTNTITQTFADQAAIDEFDADTTLKAMRQLRIAYNAANAQAENIG